ncbi:MAG: proline racemase family protein [Trueperaceae bacterium]
MQRVQIVDSHTAGEPTRLVVAGGPDLGTGPLRQRMERLLSRHDAFRTAVTREPRAIEATVAALRVDPVDPRALCGVLFVNAAGPLGMCGHATIGLIATLAWRGEITVGRHPVETPVGTVDTELHEDGRVSVDNVPSYRLRASLPLRLPAEAGHSERTVHGDVAWGGNWFFLVHDHGLAVHGGNLAALTALAARIRRALAAAGVTGDAGAEIDHVELAGDPAPGADGRAFVLCPDGTYDRSPCGTGTCAALACLAADGRLASGQRWIQESVLGSRFEASYRARSDGTIAPRITGRAWITAEATLILDPSDPFRHGVVPETHGPKTNAPKTNGPETSGSATNGPTA